MARGWGQEGDADAEREAMMSRWKPPAQKSSPYITAEGHARLKSEFDQLWRVRRPEVVKALTAAASALGCSGGQLEKESEASGVFEVNDAKCKDGQFDIKFDKDFKLLNMTKD